MSGLSPMMRHYLQIKDQYKDCVLFYRLGDFYEMFFDDAKEVSALLDLTLTGRDCGLEERAPMCGIPFHAADTYIARRNYRQRRVFARGARLSRIEIQFAPFVFLLRSLGVQRQARGEKSSRTVRNAFSRGVRNRGEGKLRRRGGRPDRISERNTETFSEQYQFDQVRRS